MDPSVVHQEAFFSAKDNLRLYWQSFAPPSARAVVGVIHGYADHSNRYHPLFEALTAAGFEVHALDYRGHGQADGRRGHVDRFHEYLDDVAIFLERMRAVARGRKLFLFGHSAGGLILARFSLERPEGVAGVVFSSPFFGLALKPPVLKVKASLLVGKLIPWLPVPNEIAIDQLTRDPEIRAATERDPLYNHVVTPRWFTEAIATQQVVLARAPEIALPSLMLVPGADAIAAAPAMREFHEKLGGADKQIFEYAGAYHEIFNELPETRQRAASDLVGWLSARS